jgi:predicted TIM-barrel fold metal-dependent hydrolase
MKIVDAHFHVWRQADLPWLTGPMQPRIFGPYEAIRRDYPMAEYLADRVGTGVEKSVYVQANWPVDQAVEDLCGDVAVRRNVARLADYAFSFDLQVFAGQMAMAAGLAAACPRVSFVLQHAGMLEDLSVTGRDAWREGMAALAACPNVAVKLSGFGTFIHRNDPTHVSWVTGETLALFGVGRCLWGSNFPIEKLWTGYTALLEAHLRAAAGLDEAARRAVFFDNACRVYRL